MIRAMWITVWMYVVAPESRSEFELAYGPDGDWAQLFSSSWGFQGIELVSGEAEGHYLTISRWESQAALDAFMRTHGDAYAALDAGLDHLTLSASEVMSGVHVGHRAFP